MEEAADFSPFVLKSKDSVLVGRLSSPLSLNFFLIFVCFWITVLSANVAGLQYFRIT